MMDRKFFASIGALALTGTSVLALSSSATAAPVAGTVTFECTMPSLPTAPPFDYAAQISADAFVASAGASPATVVVDTSELPGVVPEFISMPAQAVKVSFTGTANGQPITLATEGKTDVNPSKNGTKEPVKMPGNIQGSASAGGATVKLVLSKFDFDVAGVAGTCTSKSGDIPEITSTVGAAPAPNGGPSGSPSASSKPSPTATASPTKTAEPKEEEAEGEASEGKVTFACLLSAPFNTKFDYSATISVAGAREAADDTAVSLSAAFSDIPGLAPVPITDGPMRIRAVADVDGQEATFTGSSVVNAAANAKVPVPELSAEVKTDGETVPVEMKTFRFEFDEMGGVEISADCEAKSGSMSDMTIGVGELPATGGSSGTGGSTAGSQASLPRTGGADAMPVIGLWALALGVVGAGLLVWMPRRREA